MVDFRNGNPKVGTWKASGLKQWATSNDLWATLGHTGLLHSATWLSRKCHLHGSRLQEGSLEVVASIRLPESGRGALGETTHL